jgi:hypothetical protein
LKEIDKQQDSSPIPEAPIPRLNRVHRILARVLLLMMVLEWIVLLIDRRWLSAFLVTLIIATSLCMVILNGHYFGAGRNVWITRIGLAC